MDSVLITGGTGSFGKAMVNDLLRRGYDDVRVFSRDEAKQEEMRIEYNRPELKFYIGDVRDRRSVDNAMSGVGLVFHAAALKQVPSCEFFPLEAIKTNILGSQNLIESAVASGAKSLVCLSTDKAVMPINAMGMTKALMEKVAQAASRGLKEGDTTVSCVRYGNVMCSRGSVIPLFIRQIKEKKALTITDPSMTRFMLSLPNAIELVDFAFKNANQGDVFIRKAPACTVQVLAEAMVEIFHHDQEVRVIGTRHGEKIYETLASAEELRRADDMGDYFRVKLDGRDLNYEKYFSQGEQQNISQQDYHSHNTNLLDKEQTKALLLSLPDVVDAINA